MSVQRGEADRGRGREREGKKERGGEREREREREREGRERIPTRFHAVRTEPKVGLKIMNCEIMTLAEIKSQMLNQLNHPGTPQVGFLWTT